MNTRHLFQAAAVVLVVGASLALAAEPTVISDSDTYPLATCPVTEQPLEAMGGAITETINDREVRFCCAGCIGRYRADVDAYEAKIDAAIIEQQRDTYPTDRCVVMDTALGSMGDPVEYVHGNRLVRFCCAGCAGMFEADPDKYLAKLDAAVIERQGEAPAVCVVSGEALGDTSVTLIIANQALPLHSEACVDIVRANPAHYLDKADDASGE